MPEGVSEGRELPYQEVPGLDRGLTHAIRESHRDSDELNMVTGEKLALDLNGDSLGHDGQRRRLGTKGER